MLKKILLNKSEYIPTLQDLPCLIHGKDGMGASLFTVSLVAAIAQSGFKVVFLSGYPMARDELIDQIDDKDDVSLAESELVDSKVIFIPKERADLLAKLTAFLPDFEERIVLIKNIDLFDEKPFSSVKQHSRLILSGDIDKCSYKDEILKKEFSCKVLFSDSAENLGISFPKLDKYQGYYQNKKGVEGIVGVLK